MTKRVVDLLANWSGIRENHQVAAVWKIVPLCLTWCIWNERNGHYFENRERTLWGIIDLFFHSCYFGLRLSY